jgi:hypothetical protein
MKPKTILLTFLILAFLGLALYLAVDTNAGGFFRTPTSTASLTNTPTATATPTFTTTPTATQTPTPPIIFTINPTLADTFTPTFTNTPLPTQKSQGNNPPTKTKPPRGTPFPH